jgi:DnaJ-domain-containing protein 1
MRKSQPGKYINGQPLPSQLLMQLKDYYRILGIEPSAGYPEIRKAFRKLAHQFHPDKNQDDPYASAQFAEIKEAYDVLTHPSKKEYYLQQRWYNQSAGKKKTQGIITPVAVLKQLLELDQYVSTLDVHRMDKQGLADYINDVVSGNSTAQLIPFNESHINEQIILTALKVIAPLKLKEAEIISNRLVKLAGDHAESKKLIAEFLASKKQKEKAEKYQPFILMLIVLVICFFIWLMGR